MLVKLTTGSNEFDSMQFDAIISALYHSIKILLEDELVLKTSAKQIWQQFVDHSVSSFFVKYWISSYIKKNLTLLFNSNFWLFLLISLFFT